MQGVDDQSRRAVAKGDLSESQLDDKENCLLEFAEKLTRQPHEVRPGQIQRLRDAGWSDPQIAEGVYIIAMFAFFNRVANAFGLDDPSLEDTGRETED